MWQAAERERANLEEELRKERAARKQHDEKMRELEQRVRASQASSSAMSASPDKRKLELLEKQVAQLRQDKQREEMRRLEAESTLKSVEREKSSQKMQMDRGGVGIAFEDRLDQRSGGMLKIVAEVFSEGAAADWNSTAEEDKKIHPGDLLVEVNGERVAGLDMHTLSTMVPGPVGTPVILRLRSVKENKEFEVSVTFAHACSVHTSHVLRDCEAANVPARASTHTAHLRDELSVCLGVGLRVQVELVRQTPTAQLGWKPNYQGVGSPPPVSSPSRSAPPEEEKEEPKPKTEAEEHYFRHEAKITTMKSYGERLACPGL